jgi:hypothetical protein
MSVCVCVRACDIEYFLLVEFTVKQLCSDARRFSSLPNNIALLYLICYNSYFLSID